MAAPASMTTRNFSGSFVLNKKLSDTDAMDTILSHQGVGWIARKAISAATVTIKIKHYTDESGVEHIDIDQASGHTEKRVLNWTESEKSGGHFGPSVTQSRRAPVAEITEAWLKEGWTKDTVEHGVVETIIRSNAQKDNKTWKNHATWGFEEVGGERRYTRHIYFTDPKGEVTKARMTFDYQGA